MLRAATEKRDGATADVTSLDDAREAARTGFARLPWSVLGDDGEAQLATDGITVRCIQRADGTMPASEDEPDLYCLVARSY
jgi:prolyl-tRNA synthetase